MNLNQQSIYKLLAIIIFFIVAIIIFISGTFNYILVKNKIIENMKKNSNTTVIALKNNISNYITSYSINEYDILVSNELKRGAIFAIIVKDYNMGKILGKDAYISGKIKNSKNMIVDYEEDSVEFNTQLTKCFFHIEYPIYKEDNEEIGTISVYLTDELLKEELNSIIIGSIINFLLITFTLAFSLFIAIRFFLLQPLSNLETTLHTTDKDGIPLQNISPEGTKEIFKLSLTMNKMIELIKDSKNELELSNINLLEEKTKLKNILRNIPDLVWIKDINGVYIICNKRFEELYGVSQENEIIGKTDYDFVDKELADFFRNNDLNAMNSNIPVSNYEELPFASDGHIEPTFTTKVKILNSNGEIFGVLGIGKNIAEIKAKEDELLIQKQELQTIFDTTKDGIAIVDFDTNFLKVNKAYCDITGLSEAELLKTSCKALTIEEDFDKITEKMDILFAQGFVDSYEKRCLIHHEQIVVNMSMALLPDGKNILVSMKDMTKLKIFEEQTKLASMGEMIGNIAHQWRQPLSVITTIASGIQVKQQYGFFKIETLTDNMEHIITQANYLSQTIEDFRNFIKNTTEKQQLSIKETCEKTLSILHAALVNNNITILTSLEDDITIDGYENELMQALINIINNARDAIKEHVVDDSDKLIFIATKKYEDRFEISIQDSGGGIPEDVMPRIYEPYFTTKHQSVGTGIGLSMTHKIITQRHNGSIEVENVAYTHNEKEYKGACFRIDFKV